MISFRNGSRRRFTPGSDTMTGGMDDVLIVMR